MDRVRALKYENPTTGGTQLDSVPTEVNPAEDYLDAKGLTLGSENHFIDKAGNEIQFTDPVNGTVLLSQLGSGSGLSVSAHLILNELIHNLAENAETEVVYSANRPIRETYYTDAGKTQKIREYEFTYSGNRISAEIVTQYDDAGLPETRLTETYHFSGNQYTGSTIVKEIL